MNSHPEPPPEEEESLSSGCPWLNKKNQNNPIINPRNMMPDLPQSAAEGQRKQLSKEREISSIPKTGSDDKKWEYPSPQQFYHALLRRNKTAEEEYMDSVVSVHNQVNEDSWKQILDWEAEYAHQCKEPSLQRFVGNFEKTSPAAWIRTKMFGEVLFDRHDWFVDRCGLRSVRYVIDYYDTSNTKNADKNVDVKIHARPAIDSVQDALDRVKVPVKRWFRNWINPPTPTGKVDPPGHHYG
jgi:cytochrome c heme-lyase